MLLTESNILLLLLVALLWATFTKRGRAFLKSHARGVFWSAAGVVTAVDAYFAVVQYLLWQEGSLQRFLLPPYAGSYFFFYAFMRFLAGHAISLFFALIVVVLLPRLNRRYGSRFFEDEEPYIAATALFIVGHPGWLFFLAALIALYLFIHTAYYFLHARSVRVPLYHLWVPVAIFVILISEYWVSDTALWKLLQLN